MKNIFLSEKTYVGQSKIIPSERGVFASKDIKQGEIIETCPILRISKDDTAAIHEESLVSYMFYFGDKKDESLIALGFGSLYNHSDNPNAVYEIKSEKNIIEFSAIKDIPKDKEISVSYSRENTPLWFEK